MTSNGKKKKKATAGVDDEVEELLKAAEDEVFLKLSVNSHMSRVSPSYLHSDLDHRFQSLKKKPSSSSSSSSSSSNPNKPIPNPKPPQSSTTTTTTTTITTEKDATTIVQSVQENDVDDDDDLFARFAALKGSLPSASSSVHRKRSDHGDGGRINQPNSVDNDVDEVDKLIQWAIDAARLDPSPPTDDEAEEADDEDENENESDEDDDSDDDDDYRAKGNKKGNRK